VAAARVVAVRWTAADGAALVVPSTTRSARHTTGASFVFAYPRPKERDAANQGAACTFGTTAKLPPDKEVWCAGRA
jgi:hypothetical protein